MMHFGIELEACGIYDGAIGRYHGGIPLNINGRESELWTVESDSSIKTVVDKWNNPTWAVVESEYVKPFELVSKMQTVYNRSSIRPTVWALLEEVREALKDKLYINPSCGCHIHFSKNSKRVSSTRPTYDTIADDYIWADTQINSNGSLQIYEDFARNHAYKVRSLMKKRLKAHLPEQASSFWAHYYRSGYSSPVKKRDVGLTERCEFQAVTAGKGVEWRAFHLIGCESYWDMTARLTLGLEVLWDVLHDKQRIPTTLEKFTIQERSNAYDDVRVLDLNKPLQRIARTEFLACPKGFPGLNKRFMTINKEW